jgi:G3E family GTPase
LGCSLAASFAQLIKGFCKTDPPDYLFIEPSGLVTTEELLAASRTGLRDCSYELGPFITLLNAEDFSFNWQERRSLLISQITGAGLVCVTKIDGVSEAELASLKNVVLPYTKNLTEIVAMNGHGTQRLFSLVEDLVTSPGGNGSNG